MEIRLDTDSLEKNSYTIVGIIFVECADGYKFPGDGWYDFPVVILSWWLDEIGKLLDQTSPVVTLLFMDGPQFMRFSVSNDKAVFEVDLMQRGIGDEEVSLRLCSVRPDMFIRSLIGTTNQLVRACISRDWQTEDIDVLQRELKRFVELAKNNGMILD